METSPKLKLCSPSKRKIYNFQNNHKESFYANYIKKYEYAKQQCMKQYTINNKLLQEKKTLRSIIRNSSDQDRPISSTPIRKNMRFQNTSLSTITPEGPFKVDTSDNRGYPSFFTPMKAVPGFAQRMSASKMNNQANLPNRRLVSHIIPEQHGFFKGRATENNMVTFVEYWQDQLDNGIQSISSLNQGISPLQVVPMTGTIKPPVPVHQFTLGPMTSLQELQMNNKFNKI